MEVYGRNDIWEISLSANCTFFPPSHDYANMNIKFSPSTEHVGNNSKSFLGNLYKIKGD